MRRYLQIQKASFTLSISTTYASLIIFNCMTVLSWSCTGKMPRQSPRTTEMPKAQALPIGDPTTGSTEVNLSGNMSGPAQLEKCGNLYGKQTIPAVERSGEWDALQGSLFLPQRSWDKDLALVANYHARDMALRDFFGHISPDGCDVSHRMLVLSPWRGGSVAEILALGHADWGAAAKAWMSSEPHRRHLFDQQYDRYASAVAQSKNGKLYWIVLFGSLKSRFESPSGPDDSESDITPTERPIETNAELICPSGFSIKKHEIHGKEYSYCYGSGEVFHTPKPEEINLCIAWGGGTDSCKSSTWSERMYISVTSALK